MVLERGPGFDQTQTEFFPREESEALEFTIRLLKWYFNPVFLTKILLDSEIPSGQFQTGKYVSGTRSGAYGVIEGFQMDI